MLLVTLFSTLGLVCADSRFFFRFYKGTNVYQFVDIDLEDCRKLRRQPEFNVSRNTTIYIHGFQETVKNESTNRLVSAYLFRQEENIVALDWSNIALRPANEARSLFPSAARELSVALECLIDGYLHLHLVGYNLGAQLAGTAGRFLSKGYKLPKITALDPANTPFPLELSITSQDAGVVQVIHSDGGALGVFTPSGTVDFYVNAGLPSQPGCFEEFELVKQPNLTQYIVDWFDRYPTILPPLTACSLERSWRLYVESVLNEESFIARKSFGYPGCRAAGDTIAFMGYGTAPSATGCYFVVTGSRCPFSKKKGALSNRERKILCDNIDY